MVETRILHEQGLRERAFCAQNELNIVALCCTSTQARVVSPVSLPTAVCCSRGESPPGTISKNRCSTGL